MPLSISLHALRRLRRRNEVDKWPLTTKVPSRRLWPWLSPIRQTTIMTAYSHLRRWTTLLEQVTLIIFQQLAKCLSRCSTVNITSISLLVAIVLSCTIPLLIHPLKVNSILQALALNKITIILADICPCSNRADRQAAVTRVWANCQPSTTPAPIRTKSSHPRIWIMSSWGSPSMARLEVRMLVLL